MTTTKSDHTTDKTDKSATSHATEKSATHQTTEPAAEETSLADQYAALNEAYIRYNMIDNDMLLELLNSLVLAAEPAPLTREAGAKKASS